jgi:hypothetical protein
MSNRSSRNFVDRIFSVVMFVTLHAFLAACADAPPSNRLDLSNTDFRAMPPDQALATLNRAGNIWVTADGMPGHGNPSSWIDKYAAACNGQNVDGVTVARERACRQYLPPNFQNDPRILAFDMASLFRACGVWAPSSQSDESVDGSSCGLLGRVFFEIGNVPAARAVWEHANGCIAAVGWGTMGDGCIRFILERNLDYKDQLQLRFSKDPTAAYADDPGTLLKLAHRACSTSWRVPGGSLMMAPDRSACEFIQRNGGSVNMAAVSEGEASVKAMQADQAAQAKEDRDEQRRLSDAKFNAVMGALQTPVYNPAAGVAQVRTTLPNVGGSPAVQTTTTSPSSGYQAGSASVQYLTPLSSNCVQQFYDTNAYGWLAFQNNCGRTIYIEFIFQHNVGWAMTGAWTLPPGGHVNTGRSNKDVQLAGGLDLYVCPQDSVPVDLSGNVLVSNVSDYRCKPQ